MQAWIIALCCATVLAALEPYNEFYQGWHQSPMYKVSDETFQVNHEYRYFYDGQVLTGIPGSSRQHAGTRLQAMVVLQFRGPHVVMQLNHVRMGKLNRHVPEPRAQLPFQVFEQVEVAEELKQELSRPMKFNYQNGLIRNIHFEAEEQAWSSNIKRGVLNMLQVNLQRQGAIQTEDMRLSNEISSQSNDDKFYRVLEKTVEGECEVLYTIEHEPSRRYDQGRPVLNVTKSIDFEKCQERPDIKYNWRFAEEPCETCDPKYTEQEKFLKSQTVAKYNISGSRDNFMIESAKIESQYIMVPYNEQGSVVVTYVNQTLKLYRTDIIQNHIVSLQQPEVSSSQMVYSLDWDVSKEEFYMSGQQGEYMNPFRMEHNKVELVHELLKRLIENSRDEIKSHAPRYYAKLVTLFRQMTKQQLEQVHEQIVDGQAGEYNAEARKTIKDIVVNALALASTDDSISHIISKVRQGKLTKYETANALRQMMQARVVSSQTIEKVESLCQEPVIEESMATKQACYLTLGALMNTLCSPKDKWAVEAERLPSEICSRATKTQFVEKIAQKLQQSSNWESRVLMIKALSNAGLDVSIFKLQEIIENRQQQYSPLERVEAISALRHLTTQMPLKIQKILTPIYMNKYERSSARMAAFHQLMQTQPKRALLNMMVKNLQTESNLQVGAFAYSMLESLANSTNPCNERLASDIELALRMTRAIKPGPAYSQYMHASIHSDKTYEMGMDINAFTVMNNHTYIPRYLSWALNTNGLGFYNKKVAHVGLALKGWESLARQAFGPQGWASEGKWEDFVKSRRSARDTGRNFQQDIKAIWEQLKTNPRSLEAEQPAAYVIFTYLGQEIGFLPFSLEYYSQWSDENGMVNPWELERQLREGQEVNFNYATILEESEYKIPTSIGYPLRYNHQLPALVKAIGRVNAEIESESRLVKVMPQLKLSAAIKSIRKIEIWNPIASTGLQVQAKAKLFVPIAGHLKVNTREQTVVSLEIETPVEKREIVSLETEPILFVKPYPAPFQAWTENIETSTVIGEEINRVVKIDQPLSSQYSPIEMKLQARYNRVPQWASHLPFCPLTGPNKISLTAQPSENRRRAEAVIVQAQAEYQEESQGWESRLESQSQESMQSARHSQIKLLLKERVNGQEEQAGELVYKVQWTPSMQSIRHELQATQLPTQEQQQYKICLTSEVSYPNKPYQIEELQGKKVVSHTELKWGQSCQEGQIVMKAEAKRSEQQAQYERYTEASEECKRQQELGYDSPITCYEHLRQAGQLNRLEVDIEYQNVPVAALNATRKAFNIAKYLAFFDTDIADIKVNNPENRVKAIFDLDAQTGRYVNATVKMPRENVTMTDLKLPFNMVPLNSKSSYAATFAQQVLGYSSLKAICKIHPEYIQTFDQQEYQVPLTTCYSVLTKDCTDEQRFVVLAKKVQQGSEEKKLKILTQTQKIELEKQAGGEIQVTVNNEQVDIDQMDNIQRQGPYLKVNLPEEGLQAYFDGYSVNIKASPMMRARLCGLCGHYDLEPEDEYRTPEQSSYDEQDYDVRRFFQKYLVKDSECQGIPEDYEQLCPDQQCTYESKYDRAQRHFSSYETEQDDFEPSFEYPEESGEYQQVSDYQQRISPKSRQPRRLTQVYGTESQTCFSKRPMNVCPPSTYPAERTAMQVDFICLPRSNYRAQELQAEAQRAPVDISAIQGAAEKTEMTMKVEEPRACRLL